MSSSSPIQQAYLVASGDLRLSANQVCWPAQEAMEAQLTQAFKQHGVTIIRAHAYDETEKHGFISNQRMGMDVFMNIPEDAAVVVAEAVWQYSHHLLAGLRSHKGPILTVANWSGQWPGLVGLLNLNGSLTKANIPYSSLWSKNFDDDFFHDGLKAWINTQHVPHDTRHVQAFDTSALSADTLSVASSISKTIQHEKVIMGIFDEGCMGMYNAIIDDEMLNPMGIYKERLSQSALIAEMNTVSNQEAQSIRHWLDNAGVTFKTGQDETTDLTDAQILEQCKMYIAAVRIADRYACDTIGIQYQQGLKDMTPASDLVEGLLNNVNRPPVTHPTNNHVLYDKQAIPHFNEVDECAGVDAIITNRIWTKLEFDPATTLHDLRWGEHFQGDGVDDFVWVLEISGAAPASHFVNGYAGAVSERQPPMYFPLGGGTLKGVSKPGEIVWSRVYVMNHALHADIGRASVVALPQEETERRWQETTPQWPIMHTVLHGVSRDQMMAQHKANHIQVAYAPSAADADKALSIKATVFEQLGMTVHLCGDVTTV